MSSAYNSILLSGERLEPISFMNITNRIGPRIEPWGTPDATGRSLDCVLPITTLCALPERYSTKNFNRRPSILYCSLSFASIMSWFTESNALAKSKYIMSVRDPLLRHLAR